MTVRICFVTFSYNSNTENIQEFCSAEDSKNKCHCW
uniref:Uncharacterized protein n=1 Tax=Rhizophora mucronata TaxID=61149 RepID=A0A2P2R575_RHIMU